MPRECENYYWPTIDLVPACGLHIQNLALHGGFSAGACCHSDAVDSGELCCVGFRNSSQVNRASDSVLCLCELRGVAVHLDLTSVQSSIWSLYLQANTT